MAQVAEETPLLVEHAETVPAPPGFPQVLLNVGFICALLVAAACLVFSSWYLFTFLGATNAGIESLLQTALRDPNTSPGVIQLSILARTAMARFALLSCGVSVGMSFGFLGFALFLLGIKGEMDVSARHEDNRIKIARMAPGVFVILCATVLIGVCAASFRAEYEFRGGETGAIATEDKGAPGADTLPTTLPGEKKP